MKKEMVKKVVANKVVDLAIQTSRMPNQTCAFFLEDQKQNMI